MATTWAVLLPSRGPASPCALAASLALGALLAAATVLVALALEDAPLAACAPPLAFGSAVSPNKVWMRSQIRPAAPSAFLTFFTGFTPGILFQMATNRSGGQALASSVSSCSLAKESKGVVVVAAASSWVPKAVMLFCSSIVNVFM